MTYAKTIGRAIYDYRKMSIRALGLGVTLLLFLYGYFVVQIIFNGSRIEQIEKKMSVESSELGDLEAKYITLKNSISREEAYELGFVEVENPLYLSRVTTNTVALSR